MTKIILVAGATGNLGNKIVNALTEKEQRLEQSFAMKLIQKKLLNLNKKA